MSGFGQQAYGQGPYGGAPSGTVTDSDLLKEASYHLLENGDADASSTSLLTTMFTIAQIVDAFNQRQQVFLRDTGIVNIPSTIAATPGIANYDAPFDTIAIRRVVWSDANNVTHALTRSDTWELDYGQPTWPYTTGDPVAWYETTLPNLRFGINPPANVGQLSLWYVGLAQTLDGSGIQLLIPDDWTPYVKWGALGDLLSGDGEANDPRRADYCFQRYAEGVELARLVMTGAGGVSGG